MEPRTDVHVNDESTARVNMDVLRLSTRPWWRATCPYCSRTYFSYTLHVMDKPGKFIRNGEELDGILLLHSRHEASPFA